MTHLTDEELIELAEAAEAGAEDALPATSHATTCEACARRLASFRQTLSLTASAPVRTEWNSLQAGAFEHRVRRAIDSRRTPRRLAWWQPALGGALAALLLVIGLDGLSTTLSVPGTPRLDERTTRPATEATPVRSQEIVSETEQGLYAEVTDTDDELLLLIDAYLIDTATNDELLLDLGEFDDGELIAVLDL